jgi:hypothetical protein
MSIASSSRAHFPASPIFPALLDLAGTSFRQSPQWGYVALVRGLLGLFGNPGAAHGARDPATQAQMFSKMVEVAGIIAQHVLVLLAGLQDLENLHSVGQFFELCNEALRMGIPGMLTAPWFKEMVSTCIRIVEAVDFQQLMLNQLSVGSVGSMLRFLEATASATQSGVEGVAILQETAGISRIVFSLMKLALEGSMNVSILLPCIASALEPLLRESKCQQEASGAINQVLTTLPISDDDKANFQQKLLTTEGREFGHALQQLGAKCAPQMQRKLRQ